MTQLYLQRLVSCTEEWSLGEVTSWRPLYLSAGRKAPSLPWPDIGHLAKWSVSSFKFGFGAECLQDDDTDTFWQYVQFA